MIKLTKYIALFAAAILPMIATAQNQVAMADTFRSEGKIYVVLLVVLTIFIGIIAWLFFLGKKITKLENEQ